MAEPFVEYWNSLRNIPCEKDEMIFYRGVADSSYTFLNGTVFEPNITEDVAYHDALLEFPEEFSQKGHLSTLAKMQHYGFPTRLMDVTTNPLVALFLHVSKIKTGLTVL